MSTISNINSGCPNCTNVAGAYGFSSEARRNVEAKPSALAGVRGADRAEFSDDALKAVQGTEGAIRQDLVDSIKKQIESGTYESDSKIAIAADRIVKRFARE